MVHRLSVHCSSVDCTYVLYILLYVYLFIDTLFKKIKESSEASLLSKFSHKKKHFQITNGAMKSKGYSTRALSCQEVKLLISRRVTGNFSPFRSSVWKHGWEGSLGQNSIVSMSTFTFPSGKPWVGKLACRPNPASHLFL